MGETKDHKYCWNLFSGDRDHVTALSGDHIIFSYTFLTAINTQMINSPAKMACL